MDKKTPAEASPSSGGRRALAALEELSRNLWWSWDPEATSLWDEIAARLEVPSTDWSPRNPVLLLGGRRAKGLRALLADPGLRRRVERVAARFHKALKARPLLALANRLPGPVAYFSMEFGVHESLPIYAGGLGILAGDHTKSASDLGIPLLGVGLFYREGYFRQAIDGRGRQQVLFPRADPRLLPVEAARGPGGRELRVTVELPGRALTLKVWRVRVGRVDLVLLDSDTSENLPRDRALTHRLYIGDRQNRIIQEVIAGIGGVRAIRALGIEPAVWHLNEGHVAFLSLERIRELNAGRSASGRLSLAEAAEAVAADCVFTTHTPVPEGNEVFHLDLARRHLEPHCRAAGIPVDEYLALGLDRAGDGRPVLSMTVLAMRFSRRRNGVSKLHGVVSRRMWRKLWPGFGDQEAPIGSVTNGVHPQTWVAPEYGRLYAGRLGRDWSSRFGDAAFWARAARIPDRELWAIKKSRKREMVEFVRRRAAAQAVAAGQSPDAAGRAAAKLLDPEVFTIGFSRRFALYKRAGLLFSDRKRARKLLHDRRRPVQMVFAGKPHPEDRLGARLFEEIGEISREPAFAGRVVLLANYDIEVARHLVQGVDLWLNTPRRPLEASGTSGQKVSINGGLNLSILDGWWDEGFSPEAGWAFGKPIDYTDTARQDREDLAGLYRALEDEVIPLYYRRGSDGVPKGWMKTVKAAIARLVPQFSTTRMLTEYARDYYLPAAAGGQAVRAQGVRTAREVARWRREVERSWPLSHVIGTRRVRGGRVVEVDVFVAGLASRDLASRVSGANGSTIEPVACRALHEGVVRFSFPVLTRAAARLRIWPCHLALPHAVEVGLSLETKV